MHKYNQLGDVDFGEYEYSPFYRNTYQSYNGRLNLSGSRALLSDKQEDVTDKITALEAAKEEGFQIDEDDLTDLIAVGQELCMWDISHNMSGMVERWDALVIRAAEHRKERYNREAFDEWWPNLVALYLKMQDLDLRR